MPERKPRVLWAVAKTTGTAHFFGGRETKWEGRRESLTDCGIAFQLVRSVPNEVLTRTLEGATLCKRCTRRVLALLPESMRGPLEAQAVAFFCRETVAYLNADESTRKDIAAFFESDGPRKVHEAKLQHEEGVPTSADLEKWASLG